MQYQVGRFFVLEEKLNSCMAVMQGTITNILNMAKPVLWMIFVVLTGLNVANVAQSADTSGDGMRKH